MLHQELIIKFLQVFNNLTLNFSSPNLNAEVSLLHLNLYWFQSHPMQIPWNNIILLHSDCLLGDNHNKLWKETWKAFKHMSLLFTLRCSFVHIEVHFDLEICSSFGFPSLVYLKGLRSCQWYIWLGDLLVFWVFNFNH